jgi:hypothetical protein
MMAKKMWRLEEIEIAVSGFFTTHHHFQAQSGNLGTCTFPAFSQYAIHRPFDGRELTMKKAHWLGSAHELVEGGIVRGRADRPGLFRRDIVIQFDGQGFSLEPEGFLKRGWFLFDAEGHQLLELQPRGAFKQGAWLSISGAVDADLVAFVYYLVHMRQQEDAAATVAATS